MNRRSANALLCWFPFAGLFRRRRVIVEYLPISERFVATRRGFHHADVYTGAVCYGATSEEAVEKLRRLLPELRTAPVVERWRSE